MRLVDWSEPALAAAESYLRYLAPRSPAAAAKAEAALVAATARLARATLPGRTSLRWPGLRELSLTDWSKIIVFELAEDRISIVALVDARQDLDTLDLTPE